MFLREPYIEHLPSTPADLGLFSRCLCGIWFCDSNDTLIWTQQNPLDFRILDFRILMNPLFSSQHACRSELPSDSNNTGFSDSSALNLFTLDTSDRTTPLRPLKIPVLPIPVI